MPTSYCSRAASSSPFHAHVVRRPTHARASPAAARNASAGNHSVAFLAGDGVSVLAGLGEEEFRSAAGDQELRGDAEVSAFPGRMAARSAAGGMGAGGVQG